MHGGGLPRENKKSGGGGRRKELERRTRRPPPGPLLSPPLLPRDLRLGRGIMAEVLEALHHEPPHLQLRLLQLLAQSFNLGLPAEARWRVHGDDAPQLLGLHIEPPEINRLRGREALGLEEFSVRVLVREVLVAVRHGARRDPPASRSQSPRVPDAQMVPTSERVVHMVQKATGFQAEPSSVFPREGCE